MRQDFATLGYKTKSNGVPRREGFLHKALQRGYVAFSCASDEEKRRGEETERGVEHSSHKKEGGRGGVLNINLPIFNSEQTFKPVPLLRKANSR